MNDHQLLTLWVGAFRYHLGRMTYAVSDFCALLIEQWDDLPKPVRNLIEKELESAFKADDLARSRGAGYFELGMDCDRAEWEKVRRLWTKPKEPTQTSRYRDNIAKDWASDKVVQEVCLKLFDYGQSIEITPETISEFGFGDLRSIVGSKPSEMQLMKAIQYLCGDRSPVLVAVFTLEDGSLVPGDAVKKAMGGGKLFHPATGEEIKDPCSQVMLKFQFLNKGRVVLSKGEI